jgi:hypothetical protein
MDLKAKINNKKKTKIMNNEAYLAKVDSEREHIVDHRTEHSGFRTKGEIGSKQVDSCFVINGETYGA